MSTDKPDIVYIYKNFGNDNELRYSLRSLKNIPHNKVFISGDMPSWIKNVYHIPPVNYEWGNIDNRFIDAEKKWRAACEDERVGEHFLVFNDDFFAMRPVAKIKPRHRGRIQYSNVEDSSYQLALSRTKKLLLSIGDGHAFNYELHTPMVMRKNERLAISLVFQNYFRRGQILLMRSLYGNIFNVGGKMIPDVKNIRSDYWANSEFLSTTSSSFQQGIGKYIKSQFLEPSPYET